ncbi:MAG: sulfite exporter TauE/SafE family protein [Armatimonadota bacterium]|nr:sulfite exporter TauE/SafE family protein [Armatimonadota bacterium]MCX7777683.1 sulfite exporter TauE/SafE family protein [Armatimonadota bacterium]MDW8025442.1 sulfite exporter TauE/SafE family protein [Armatimonadota bacterium]
MKLALLMMVGLFAGAYGCIIGAGGGFILMPVLLLMHPYEEPSSLTATCLTAVFMNALSGSIAYARAGRIKYKCAGALAAGTLPGGVVGALLTGIAERKFFNLAFGILLLALSAYLFLRKETHSASMGECVKCSADEAPAVRRSSIHCDAKGGVIIVALIGCAVTSIATFAGVGGGIVLVPALVGLVGMPTHIATATSMLVVCLNSLVGVLTHLFSGTVFSIFDSTVIGVGMIIGAQIGAAISGRISSIWILHLLAGALGIVGVRILLTAV